MLRSWSLVYMAFLASITQPHSILHLRAAEDVEAAVKSVVLVIKGAVQLHQER